VDNGLHQFPTRRASDLAAPAKHSSTDRTKQEVRRIFRAPLARRPWCGGPGVVSDSRVPRRARVRPAKCASPRPGASRARKKAARSEEHTSELQSRENLV